MDGIDAYPLHKAVARHDPEGVRTALANGADVRGLFTWREYRTPFEPIDLLCSYNIFDPTHAPAAIECLSLLVDAGAIAQTQHGALRLLLLRTHCDPVHRYVIRAFLEKTQCDPTPGLIILHHHTEYDSKVYEALLEYGADPNVTGVSATHDPYSIGPSCPLHNAVCTTPCTRKEAVDLLLRYGADPYWVDPVTGMTALGWARHVHRARGSKDTASLLTLFEDLETCRRRHTEVWPALKKELMETVWHPSRLARLGYFDVEL